MTREKKKKKRREKEKKTRKRKRDEKKRKEITKSLFRGASLIWFFIFSVFLDFWIF
jgi:hypothetical protein